MPTVQLPEAEGEPRPSRASSAFPDKKSRRGTHNIGHALQGGGAKHVSELDRATVFDTLDKDGSGTIDKDEFVQLYDEIKAEVLADTEKEHELENKVVKSKRRQRFAICVAIAMTAFLCLSMVGNAAMTYIIVMLSRDVGVNSDGRMINPHTGEELSVRSADISITADGSMVSETGTSVETSQHLERATILDSRLDDDVWRELKYVDISNAQGGLVHLLILATSRVPCAHSLYGSYIRIHSSIGAIQLDGDIMTFHDEAFQNVFRNAGFEVSPTGRRLQGAFNMLGFFNRIPSFEQWNTTYDEAPRVPPIFYTNATVMLSCSYGNRADGFVDLCDQVGFAPSDKITYDGKLWAKADMEMWGDTDAGFGKEVFSSIPNFHGWSFEIHHDTNGGLEHKAQTWEGSGEKYFCRTTESPEMVQQWLSPMLLNRFLAAYRGLTLLDGVQVHHFRVKPREVEAYSLDFYMIEDGVVNGALQMLPYFVQLRIGHECNDDDARYFAYQFHTFEVLSSLPQSGPGAVFVSNGAHFNETECSATLPYTQEPGYGQRTFPYVVDENMIHNVIGLTPTPRTALTYYHTVLGFPSATAQEVVQWQNTIVQDNNYTARADFDIWQHPNDMAARRAHWYPHTSIPPPAPPDPPSPAPPPVDCTSMPPFCNSQCAPISYCFDVSTSNSSCPNATFIAQCTLECEEYVACFPGQRRRLENARDAPAPIARHKHTPMKGSLDLATIDDEKLSEQDRRQLFFHGHNPHHHRPHNHRPHSHSPVCVDDVEYSSCQGVTLNTDGFPFNFAKAKADAAGQSSGSLAEDDSFFPCDISLTVSTTTGNICQGEIGCQTPDITFPACPLVSGWVGGSGGWDCDPHMVTCSGFITISGGLDVGIPNCRWCPSLLSFQIDFSLASGIVTCCEGDFSYRTMSVTVSGSFISIVHASGTAKWYEDLVDDDRCITSRASWVGGAHRKFVLSGDVTVCLFFCFGVAEGNIHMVNYE